MAGRRELVGRERERYTGKEGATRERGRAVRGRREDGREGEEMGLRRWEMGVERG